MDINQQVASNLKRFREIEGLSLREAGRLSNLSYQTVSSLEKGKSANVNTLIQLAKVYRVDVNDLFGERYISAEGASLVSVYEGLNEDYKKTVLDFVKSLARH